MDATGFPGSPRKCAWPIRPTARLHRDLPEVDTADLGEDLLDEIVDPHRYPSRGDDHVSDRRRLPQARLQLLPTVGHDSEVGHQGPALLGQRPQREPVGIVDLARLARSAGLGDLVAGGEQRHARTLGHQHLAQP
jgi:hypothetical protein